MNLKINFSLRSINESASLDCDKPRQINQRGSLTVLQESPKVLVYICLLENQYFISYYEKRQEYPLPYTPPTRSGRVGYFCDLGQ